MNDEAQSPEGEAKALVEPARLCKGTMPSPLVWYIKFHEDTDNKSSVAKKYFTTPGKIADIQGNSNQKYIVEQMKWSAEELDAAVTSIKDNFVRGQEAEAAAPGSVSKRGLATTNPGDEDASLEAIENIRSMDVHPDAVTLEEARAAYNAENPRAPRKAKSADDTASESVEEADVGEEFDEDDLDGLLDD